ncbi:MAG: AbrB/MazE/SpoVT family DNA-binding domain-containing protein [Bacteroidota bacterium]|nr:AbrB/MazE/SpoVT family DNA-binding domain-containing protein [Bacteroidota bacterium]
MDANIIKVGNSNGIILPAALLKELKLSTKSTVRIDVEKGAIVIRPGVRQGWEEAAIRMRQNGDDELLIPDVFEDEHMEDWTWE